jgi:hypothetical protein
VVVTVFIDEEWANRQIPDQLSQALFVEGIELFRNILLANDRGVSRDNGHRARTVPPNPAKQREVVGSADVEDLTEPLAMAGGFRKEASKKRVRHVVTERLGPNRQGDGQSLASDADLRNPLRKILKLQLTIAPASQLSAWLPIDADREATNHFITGFHRIPLGA